MEPKHRALVNILSSQLTFKTFLTETKIVKVIVTDVTTVGFELQCIVTDLGELRARQGDEAASGGNHLSHSAQTTTRTITTEQRAN